MQRHLTRSGSFLIMTTLWFGSLWASAQDLQGRFYPEKDSFMLGEPVVFNVEIKNTGKQFVYIPAKRSNKCLDTYDFSVSASGSACSAQWKLSCDDDESALEPGDGLHGQWPLDSWFRFEHEGKYVVSATRHVPVRNTRGEIQDFTFSSKFEFTLKPADPLRVQTVLQDFERNLHSDDPDVRDAALDVLATAAPRYFKATALRLAQDEDPFIVAHAIAALGRMNTPETRAALADFLASGPSGKESAPNKHVSDYGTARIRAIEALGRSGDASNLDVVERYADDKNEYVQLAAMVAIAELGKAEAIPQLHRFLFSSDPVTRRNAAYGLRYSTVPDAVETLIEAIADKDLTVRERAIISLKELTESKLDTVPDAAAAQEIQNQWRSWWEAHKDKFVIPELRFLCDMK